LDNLHLPAKPEFGSNPSAPLMFGVMTLSFDDQPNNVELSIALPRNHRVQNVDAAVVLILSLVSRKTLPGQLKDFNFPVHARRRRHQYDLVALKFHTADQILIRIRRHALTRHCDKCARPCTCRSDSVEALRTEMFSLTFNWIDA
jgi:hypothetical protein